MANRFDLEQQIMDCWHVVDDLKILFENVVEDDRLSKDTISNVVLGLEQLYHMKFDKMFRTFEQVTKDEWRRNNGNWDAIPESNKENKITIKKARRLLSQYLDDFPEHDQGDIRVWQAYELLFDLYKNLGDDGIEVEETEFPKRPHIVADWDAYDSKQVDWVEEIGKDEG